MRVTVGTFNRASTGAISAGIPTIAMGWPVRSCAACREGAAASSNAKTKTRNAFGMIVGKFVVRKVPELSHSCRLIITPNDLRALHRNALESPPFQGGVDATSRK